MWRPGSTIGSVKKYGEKKREERAGVELEEVYRRLKGWTKFQAEDKGL